MKFKNITLMKKEQMRLQTSTVRLMVEELGIEGFDNLHDYPHTPTFGDSHPNRIEVYTSHNRQLCSFESDWNFMKGKKVLLIPKQESRWSTNTHTIKHYTSGIIRLSEFTHFGDYHFLVKMPDFIGAWGACWLYGAPAFELDFEQFSRNHCQRGHISAMQHWWNPDIPISTLGYHNIFKGKRFKVKAHKNPVLLSITWRPTYVTWFINGKEVYHSEINIPQNPMECNIGQLQLRHFDNMWGQPWMLKNMKPMEIY